MTSERLGRIVEGAASEVYLFGAEDFRFRLVNKGARDNLGYSIEELAGLTPWDHAAGALIARRAGCHVAMLDGSDYRADTRDGYLLAAANLATWNRLRDLWSFLSE